MTPAEVYARALEVTLAEEGGLSDHPADKGGRTYRGVTTVTYNAYRTSRGLESQDVALISQTELEDVYRSYWTAVDGDTLAPSLAVVAFDVSINSGPGRARAWLAEGHRTAGALTARRLLHYADLSTWDIFGQGWARRAARVLAAADRLEAPLI